MSAYLLKHANPTRYTSVSCDTVLSRSLGGFWLCCDSVMD